VLDEVLLVFKGVLGTTGVVKELLFKEVIVAMLAGTGVVTGVWEKVIGAEGEQVEFTHFGVVEVVTVLEADVEGVVTVMAH